MVRRRNKRTKQSAATASSNPPQIATSGSAQASLQVVVKVPKDTSLKLPKDAIKRINIGQSFAEYDAALNDPTIYVHTPALAAAADPESGKVFFVGRRGTGKTAIRRYCALNGDQTRVIVPEIFSPSSTLQEVELLRNVKQRPFRSLVTAFRRAIQIEIVSIWLDSYPTRPSIPSEVQQELDTFADLDFDLRSLKAISRISGALADGDDERWLRENKIAKQVADGIKKMWSNVLTTQTVLIDSIDDYWEGSDEGLVYLTAFMHACQEVSTQIPKARAILFLRENIFERVRALDTESSRIETAVVGMEWTERQLLEVVERRLNRNLTAKFDLKGGTWQAFFEQPDDAWRSVLDYCQRRPRDVLIYASNAVEAAQGAGHERILIEDVQQARRRFSDNRFKDLGDEYSENYPRIATVLSRFYGLGTAFTFAGVESLIMMLLDDPEVSRFCGTWIYENSSPEKFIRLLYDIGFVGIRSDGKPVKFRALGPMDTSPPPVSNTTDIVIHRCYWDALDLQDRLVRDLSGKKGFGKIGIIEDLPGGFDPNEYADAVEMALSTLQELPLGTPGATDFEEVVGDVLKLCFFEVS